MHYRSHTTRSHRARSARLGWAALALLGLTGCQNNAERDLIARDRRMQEDQIYAMEDYISQYQQLVRRYRSENAALRCRLAGERGDTAVEREPQPMPRTPTSRPATKNGPTIEIPPTPGAEKKRGPTPELEMPEVPPLKQSTSADADRGEHMLAGQTNGNGDRESPVLAAAYDASPAPRNSADGEAAGDGVSITAGQRADISAPSTPTSPDILLTGEVVENDTGGGPRLVVDVEPFDRSGRIARFDGNVSLMLVASAGEGRHQNLGRWDFGPAEVRSAVDATASEPTMRFHIELPAGTKVDDTTELWVRLTPTRGGKMLSHAKIDLSRASVFSSRTDKIWPSEESVVATSYVETAPKPAEVASTVTEGAWAIAQPGKPANLPPESDGIAGGWKATNELVPAAVASNMPVAAKDNVRPSGSAANSKSADAKIAKKPGWSPDRPRKSSDDSRPSWSATR